VSNVRLNRTRLGSISAPKNLLPMRNILDSNMLTENRPSRSLGGQTDELDSVLDSRFRQIYTQYSGNLRAFFKELEEKSKKPGINNTPDLEDRCLANAK